MGLSPYTVIALVQGLETPIAKDRYSSSEAILLASDYTAKTKLPTRVYDNHQNRIWSSGAADATAEGFGAYLAESVTRPAPAPDPSRDIIRALETVIDHLKEDIEELEDAGLVVAAERLKAALPTLERELEIAHLA